MTVRLAPVSENRHRQGEEGVFTPCFDKNGLLTAVVTDAAGWLLMVAHMNAQALDLTLASGIAHFWSRSRNSLWKKGERSGNLLHVIEMRTDCDQDSVWLKVRVDGEGVACHTGARSCFYRRINVQNGAAGLMPDTSSL